MNRRIAVLPATVAAGAAVAIGAGLATGATSHPAAVTHRHGVTEPAIVKAFSAYGDQAKYDLVPGGNFAPRTAAWSLSGGASIVANRELAARTGAHALSLGAGSSATSAAFPGGDVHTVRLFVENTGSAASNLKVSATVSENGVPTQISLGTIAGSSLAPSPILTLPKALQVELTRSDAPLKITVSSTGAGGDWLVKNVYVDPYQRCC